jgi:Tfp pilus assembly protein PilF
MRKWFLKFLLIFLYCFVFSSLSFAQEKLPDIVKKTAPSIVLIFTYDSEGEPLAQGSGFFISENGNVVTNRHVLEDSNRAEIKTAKGETYSITKILAEDKEGDIVLVSVEIPPKIAHPLQVSSSIPEVGERILVIGNPLGLEQTVSDGIVSAVRDIPAFGNIIQITAPISSGSSGSPVVNTKGEVIGVATFQMVEGQNLNFVIPSERIENLKIGKGKDIAEWQKEDIEKWLSSTEGFLSTGFFYLMKDNYEEALSYFEKAIKKDPNDIDGYFLIGYCKSELGYYEEAIEAFKQVIRINPDYYAEVHYNLGIAYDNLGRYQESLESYKQAIRINPVYAEAYYGLGSAYDKLAVPYLATGNLKNVKILATEAVKSFKYAIRINPSFAEAHYGLGLAYLLLEDKGSALEQYKILKKLDTDLANQLFKLIYE